MIVVLSILNLYHNPLKWKIGKITPLYWDYNKNNLSYKIYKTYYSLKNLITIYKCTLCTFLEPFGEQACPLGGGGAKPKCNLKDQMPRIFVLGAH